MPLEPLSVPDVQCAIQANVGEKAMQLTTQRLLGYTCAVSESSTLTPRSHHSLIAYRRAMFTRRCRYAHRAMWLHYGNVGKRVGTAMCERVLAQLVGVSDSEPYLFGLAQWSVSCVLIQVD